MMEKLHGSISPVQKICGKLISQSTLGGSLTVPTIIEPEAYGGTYEVTPTNSVQVLNTNGYVMRNDVAINPIPSNYGLITWDGAILTVS